MQTIINSLKNGTAIERLAIVSDIVTILGISMATVIGGAFALTDKLDIENVLGTIIAGLFSLAGVLVVITLFLGAASWLKTHPLASPRIRKLLLSALWLMFAALCIYASYFAYVVLTSLRFVKP